MSFKNQLLKTFNFLACSKFFAIWNMFSCGLFLTLKAPIPEKGQTHSNNSSPICRRIVWVCLTIFWYWRLSGLKTCKLNFEVCLGELTYHWKNSNIFVNFSYPFVLLVRYCLLLVLVYLELHKPFLLATSRIATIL